MASVKLFLLGSPRIELDGEIIELGLRKAVALVAYLAITRQPHSRDHLAGFFWPESNQVTARSNLRRTLYRIQHLMGKDFLLASSETLTIAPQAGLWLDVTAFEACLTNYLPDAPSSFTLTQDCKNHLENAAALYTDDFMAGFFLSDSSEFEEWQFFEREKLQQLFSRLLAHLAHAYLLEGNTTAAIPIARRWLSMDALHEPAHRLLMELYSRSGQQAAALRQYQECARLLKESLGVTPEDETIRLYEAIHKGTESWHIRKTTKPAEINYVQSGDVHIAYQVIGSGPVDLLIIHGWISHLEQIWEGPGVASALNRLAEFSRLILFDKRGVGLSDRVGYPPTLEHTMDDIRAVMDAVGSKRAVLFGYSEGGPNSLVFCATYPQLVSGLILYGTMARATRAPDYPMAMPKKSFDKWMEIYFSIYGKPIPQSFFAPSYADDKELWEWFARLMRLGSSPGEIKGVFEILREIDVRNVLPAIHVPTLVLHRKGDLVFRIDSGHYLAEHIPGARFVELPGQDHWWWLGDTKSVIDEIERFVSDLKPPKSVDRTLVTILCLEALEELGTLISNLELIKEMRHEIKEFHGKLVKGEQDVLMAAFDGPSRAIECAITLRHMAAQHNIPSRLALHTGECSLSGEELQGPAREIALSILKTAKVGEVLLSRTVKDLVVGAGFPFQEVGVHLLSENLDAWELYKI